MSKEKQIEEMASFVCSSFHGHHDCENCSLYEERCCVSFGAAKRLYNAGYRKQSEGEWLTSDIPQEKYVCSICGGACWYYDCQGEVARSRYCPNCGARMKGGAG